MTRKRNNKCRNSVCACTGACFVDDGTGDFAHRKFPPRKFGNPINETNLPNTSPFRTHQQGWECPKCGSVYAPFMTECKKCNRNDVPTCTVTIGAKK